MSHITRVITSTADLTPAGVLGYTKGIAAVISGILVVLVPLFPIQYAQWIQAAIAVCGAIAVIALPNPVKPVAVTPYPSPASASGTVKPYEDDLGGPIN